MDLTVVSTFRCNSRCQMCHVWQNPTEPKEEVSVETLAKLPAGFDNVNISGGEPTLRKDLAEIVDVLYPKARVLEISSNGLYPERLLGIVRKYPNIKIRFSLEGNEETNRAIRGERNGYGVKVAGLRKLRDAGGKDLGFAIVIQDENVDQLVEMYEFASSQGFELATSTLHNAWQFYKNDNYFYDRLRVAHAVEGLIVEMLSSARLKNWFRAYLNLGLIAKILGQPRLMPCSAGTEFVFIDPWSDVWACNVRTDLPMGNLSAQDWDEIMGGALAEKAKRTVGACTQNCWMVTTARTAMRNKRIPGLPKYGPLAWVMSNKLRLMFGGSVPFERYVDFDAVSDYPNIPRRQPSADTMKGRLVRGRLTPDRRYPLKNFNKT